MDFDTTVKVAVYRATAESGSPPLLEVVAEKVGATAAAIKQAYGRLRASRLLLLESDGGTIRMAPPFSAIKTSFLVQSDNKSYYGNCIWDALAIPAALHQDAIIHASDGYTGEPITLEVRQQKILPEPCVIHFAVPAALWWKNVIYT